MNDRRDRDPRGSGEDDWSEPGWPDEDWEEPERTRPQPAPQGGDGVRILGAEEAREAIERGDVSGRRAADEPRFGDVPPRPDPDVEPAGRFPRAGRGDPGPLSQGPTWSASSGDVDDVEGDLGDLGEDTDGLDRYVEDAGEQEPGLEAESEELEAIAVEPSGPVEMPHWTEPATGEVPQVIADEDEDDAWRHASGRTPRYRDHPGDWDESDFADDLGDDQGAFGALAGDAVVDEDAEFAEQVARRRTRPSRTGPSRGTRQERSRRRERAEAPPAAPPEAGGRDLPTALITAGVIAVLAIVCLVIGRTATTYFAALIVGVASVEIYAAFRNHGYRPAALIGILGSVALVIASYERGDAAYPIVTVLVVLFALFWYLAEVVRGEPTVNVAMTLLGFGYVGILGGFAGLVLTHVHGVGLILGMAICAIGYDVAGYFVGSAIGRTPLAPRISPHKTVEGLVAGMAASVLLGLVVAGQITPWSVGSGLVLGIAVAIAAPLGDLCESMIKRDLGVKDLGTLLPGHGGVIDRFDAILFSLPVVYYLALALDL